MKTTRKTAASAPVLSLHQRIQVCELERHKGRLAAIKRIEARLALLDAFMPAIEAANIFLDLPSLTDWSGRSLWLSTGVLNHPASAQLVNVLVAAGMAVVERKDHPGGDATVHLKKGRLLLTVLVDRRAVNLLEVSPCA
ncbi:hypothetical protein [Acidovorax sp. LjRoot194]|uniref:hypothetical protein n=1 Tax=Acidovorax sp. LjRoot194 TaxID=3342280 RepID=UPI003ECF386D